MRRRRAPHSPLPPLSHRTPTPGREGVGKSKTNFFFCSLPPLPGWVGVRRERRVGEVRGPAARIPFHALDRSDRRTRSKKVSDETQFFRLYRAWTSATLPCSCRLALSPPESSSLFKPLTCPFCCSRPWAFLAWPSDGGRERRSPF